MSGKKTLIMSLVLFVALGGYLLSRQEPAAVTEQRVALFEPSWATEITYLSVISSFGSYVFDREQDSPWQMQTPRYSWVSEEKFAKFLQAFFSLEAVDTIQKEAQDETRLYGLDTPFAFIRFKSGDRSNALTIGRLNEISNRYYAQTQSSNNIFLLEQQTIALLLSLVQDIRNRQVYDFELSSVFAVVILNPDSEPITLRNEADVWEMKIGEILVPTNSEAVNQALSALKTLRADGVTEVVGPEMKLYGLAGEATVLSLEYKQANKWGERYTTTQLGIGLSIPVSTPEKTSFDAPGFFVKPSDEASVYRFITDHFAVWREPARYFRSRRLFLKSTQLVEATRFSTVSSAATAICKSEASCKEFTDVLTSLEAVEYVNDDSEEFKLLLALEVATEAAKTKQTLALFRFPSDPEYRVKLGIGKSFVMARISEATAQVISDTFSSD